MLIWQMLFITFLNCKLESPDRKMSNCRKNDAQNSCVPTVQEPKLKEVSKPEELDVEKSPISGRDSKETTHPYVIFFVIMCCAFLCLMLFHDKFGVTKEYTGPAPEIVEDYTNAQVGDFFYFGRYPQGTYGKVRPIIWRVLKRDSNSLLVIADKGLDCKRYNEQVCDTTWADCTFRHWLNKEFLEKAFSEQEQSLIKTTLLTNNAGPSTEDRIFLLSVDEAQSLFTSDDDRKCESTDYAVKNGAYTYRGSAWWWLRSRGSCSYRAALVSNCGFISINGYYVIDNVGSVRPALRLTI